MFRFYCVRFWVGFVCLGVCVLGFFLLGEEGVLVVWVYFLGS